MDSDSFRCRTVGWRALFADTSKSGENTRLQSESSNQNRTTSPNNQISPKPQRQKQGGLWPQVWPQKQALRNRAAPSALQKVATKHLQSPHAPHHTLMTVSNHRTIGQPRALTHRPRCIISDPSHLSAASLIPETGYLRTEIKPKGRLKADNSMNT